MLENVGRKVLLVATILVIALAFLLRPEPFNLGLDLRGGTRIVYSLDLEGARRAGKISPQESDVDILAQTIDIFRKRVDPTGVLDPVIRSQGTDRIVVELPGTLGSGQTVESALAEPVGDGRNDTITLVDENAGQFPAEGATIQIGDEELRYAKRDGRVLSGLTRGANPAAYEAGTKITLVSDDAFRRAIENLGNLTFRIVATPGDFLAIPETDLEQERQRMTDWVTANPGARLVAFNDVPPEEGGPHPSIRWYPMRPQGPEDTSTELQRTGNPVLVPTNEEWNFRGEDLGGVYPTQDRIGYPAVGFEMKGSRANDFGDFTEENEGNAMAIVLNEEIQSAPATIEGRLQGQSQITSPNFTEDEVRSLITVLRSGSLKIKPTLEYQDRVGATLGSDYVKLGMLSSVLAVLLVLGFMIVYYRTLGLWAAVALLATGIMVMGGLGFLDATLTLPGIAGLILTVGMAVDANILIFDRLREELDKGRNVKQAAKAGFEKALSAILDANITTLLTAIILYNVGTGPVKGFAVTLMIGIVASVFAALLITRLLVHWSLVRGAKGFPMGQWMVQAKYAFLSKAKVAMLGSAVAVLAGLTLFIIQPESLKYGIDFLSGTEVHFRTAQPESIDAVRERIAAIEDFGDSASVRPVLGSAQGDGYTEFRAIFKDPGDLGSDNVTFDGLVQRAVGDILLNDPLQVTAGDAPNTVAISLVTTEQHSSEDLTAALEGAGLQDVQTETVRSSVYAITASTSEPAAQVRANVERVLGSATDSGGNGYGLAGPIASTTTVGPQVVGELKDKAVLAIGVSLFAIVLYIRVRFAEYSYGFAAVAALGHDVLVTLGALALINATGLINGEITLPMIAAFLTIIGYSLNDTIVIFDRVRENLPMTKAPLEDVLNKSINQTLSRTILTSVTTFIAVLTLFVFNYGTGNVLESFSFAMMVGVIAGTYSTIFIANPVLLFFERRRQATAAGEADDQTVKSKAQPV